MKVIGHKAVRKNFKVVGFRACPDRAQDGSDDTAVDEHLSSQTGAHRQ